MVSGVSKGEDDIPGSDATETPDFTGRLTQFHAPTDGGCSTLLQLRRLWRSLPLVDFDLIAERTDRFGGFFGFGLGGNRRGRSQLHQLGAGLFLEYVLPI